MLAPMPSFVVECYIPRHPALDELRIVEAVESAASPRSESPQ
jgi:hypothetical protein